MAPRDADVAISDLRSLRALIVGRPKLRRPGKIRLRLDGLGDDESRTWQSRLNAHYAGCGCGAGATVMIATVALYTLVLGLRVEDVADVGWPAAVLGVVVAVLGAVAGKVLSRVRARRRLEEIADELDARLAGESASG